MMRDWENFFTFDEINKLLVKSNTEIHETINAKIREALEAAPKVYGQNENLADGVFAWQFSEIKVNTDTHVGSLINVKPIEKGET
jgi:hypothetical protein